MARLAYFCCCCFLWKPNSMTNDRKKNNKTHNKNENMELCKQMPTMTSIGCRIQKKTTAIHPNIGFLFLFNHLRIQIKYTFLPGCNFKWLHVRYEMIFNVRKSQFQLVFLIEWRQLKVFWFYANETRKFTANCTCSW